MQSAWDSILCIVSALSWSAVLLKHYCIMSPHFPTIVPKICDELSGLTETQVYLDWVVTLFLKQRGKSNLIEFPVTLTGIYGHTCFSEPSQSTTK